MSVKLLSLTAYSAHLVHFIMRTNIKQNNDFFIIICHLDAFPRKKESCNHSRRNMRAHRAVYQSDDGWQGEAYPGFAPYPVAFVQSSFVILNYGARSGEKLA
ncbi:hypothetical protein QUF61_12985 [Candidatus Venteria ishoeyi]|uniref:hypothetical protein n=1 Tax=Candidatus Venteria ishoeyi TaxID=1899563 RepID=UPI0025A4E9C9|nr:hypothetical protein [Candidatus Venteria ishoeyi]MDM8547403.1 hypothetical protein [Candidatus Venteria ishoeyi]